MFKVSQIINMASHTVTISALKKRKNGQVSAVDVARNGGSGGSGVGGGVSTHVARNGGRGVGGGLLSHVACNGGSGGSGVGGGLSSHVAHNGGSGRSGLGGGFSTPPHIMVNELVSIDEYNRLMKKNSSLQGMLVKMEMNVASVAKKGQSA